MPYTPPAGNAVNFNFTGAYSPPTGNNVIFNFGGGGPPPPGSQLPTGHAIAFIEEPMPWQYFMPQRRFAPVPVPIVAFPHRGLTRFRLDEEEPWIMPRRSLPGFKRKHKRATLFTVT
jgi:hypothetical protein